MAKIKLNEFKKFLASLNEDELKAEMLKLIKLEQVQAFYAQDLMSEADREKMLQEWKQKIRRQLITPAGKVKSNISNANIRKLISEFEKVVAFEYDLIDLLLHRVEVTIEADIATEDWGLKSGDYNAALKAFERAIKLIQSNNFLTHFEQRCDAITEVKKDKAINYTFNLDLYDIYRTIKELPEIKRYNTNIYFFR
jgi:tetratricopeptide (TPR) repeat protein